MNFGSNKLCKDLRGLIAMLLGLSSRSIKGMGSSGDEGATIGAARASGEDTDEGVDDLVASCWRGLRADRFDGGDMAFVTGRTLAAAKCAGDNEDIG
jgi:hypothetical protein